MTSLPVEAREYEAEHKRQDLVVRRIVPFLRPSACGFRLEPKVVLAPVRHTRVCPRALLLLFVFRNFVHICNSSSGGWSAAD